MDCNKVIENLSALIDDELTNVEKEEILSHIAECSECRKRYEELKKIKKDFAKLNVTLNGRLAESVMTRVYNERPKKKTPFFFRYIGTAAALVIIVAVAMSTRLAPRKEAMIEADSFNNYSNSCSDYKFAYSETENAPMEKAEVGDDAGMSFVQKESISDGFLDERIECEDVMEIPTAEEPMMEAPKAEEQKYAPSAASTLTIYVDAQPEEIKELFKDSLIETVYGGENTIILTLSQEKVIEILDTHNIAHSTTEPKNEEIQTRIQFK